MASQEHDRVYILGAGHGGCVTALTLAEAGIPVTLIDKETVVSQGPACHLHAFGGIYPEMPDLESLPEHAISFGLAFPQAVDLRPTLVVLAPHAPWSPAAWHERLRAGSEKYRSLLDTLEPRQRRALVPEGAPILEVLRTSVCAAPTEFSPWGVQAAAWLPDEARDAVLIWEAGINCIRLAGLLEHSLAKAGPLIELRLGTAVTSLEPDGEAEGDGASGRWRLMLEGADGVARSEVASAVVDARGAHSAAGAPAEYKCVFWADHPTAPNEPEVVVLDRRGGPGLTQYTPGAFGSRLHKMIDGASLFGTVAPAPPSAAQTAALHQLSRCPDRCRATYALARSVLRPGTLPPPPAIRPLPTVARFQRLPASGSAEARTSAAVERRAGLIDLLLSKTVSAPAVAHAVLALLRTRRAPSQPEPPHPPPPPHRRARAEEDGEEEKQEERALRQPALVGEEEVLRAAERVCQQRGLPLLAAVKYDWTILKYDCTILGAPSAPTPPRAQANAHHAAPSPCGADALAHVPEKEPAGLMECHVPGEEGLQRGGGVTLALARGALGA